MTYKGYTGKITGIDEQTGAFFGVVADITDVITFEAMTGPDLIREFQISIDAHLASCARRNRAAPVPLSGNLTVTIPQNLFSAASRRVELSGTDLNSYIQALIATDVAAAAVPAKSKPRSKAKPLPAVARKKAKVTAKSSTPSGRSR